MLVIKAYLKMRDEQDAKEQQKEGKEYTPRNFSLFIEKLTPLNVGCVIPMEFSLAYKEE